MCKKLLIFYYIALVFFKVSAKKKYEDKTTDVSIELFTRITDRPTIKDVNDEVNNRIRRRGDTVIETTNGLIRGYRDSEKYNFLGIRYGQAPVGERRFSPALPVEPWTGEYNARQYGHQCPQVPVITNRYTGNEDCLFLNIYFKDYPKGNKSLSVMFWIHGGAFKGGGGNFPITGAGYLVQEDVMLITINYRVGPLGFLSVNEMAPGNVGLQDQILALKWVKEHIAAFGGNPDDITIFGQSAGAVSVDALVLTPLTKGLFHKAIAQSGSILNPWAISPNPKRHAFLLGRSLGYNGNSSTELVRYLRNQSVTEIIWKSLQLTVPDEERNLMDIFFTPVIEESYPCNKGSECHMPVLTKHPLKILKSGKYNKVPYLAGFTSDEGLIVFRNSRIDTKGWHKFQTTPKYFIPSNVQSPAFKDSQVMEAIADEINYIYTGGQKINQNIASSLVEYATDLQFLHGIVETLRYHVLNGNNATFMYRFAYEGKLNFFKRYIRYRGQGVCHGDELGYLFTAPNIFYFGLRLKPRSPETIMKNRMVKMWTSFAKFGDPNPPDGLDIIFDWEPISSPADLKFLNIDYRAMEMDSNPNSKRIEFWDEFFTEYTRI